MIVSLVPYIDMAPVPRVDIRLEPLEEFDGGSAGGTGAGSLDGGSASSTVSGFDGGTASIAVVDVPADTERIILWRTMAGRRMKVRAAVDRVFTGTFGHLDQEVGRGTATYELECWSDTAHLGTVSLGSVVMPEPEKPYETVVQQPLNPNLSAVVEEFAANVPSIRRFAPSELVDTEGGAYPQLVGFGPRSGLRDVEIDFVAKTREIAASVWATQGTEERPQLPVLLIRSTHPLLPPVFFCEVRDLREVGVNLHVGGEQSRFVATVNEIRPPAPALVAASLRYSDLAAVFGTYSAMAAALPSYSRWSTAWEYAGAAG